MGNIIKKLTDKTEKNSKLKTIVFSSLSSLLNIAYALFNCILWLTYGSLWNGTISIYWLMLFVVRIIILIEQRAESGKRNVSEKTQNFVYVLTHLLLLVTDLTLIVPIAIMIKGDRSYTYGLIPAIAMATYTTYRITASVIHYKRTRHSDKLFIAELRTINLSDSLVSVLSLQNALITANGGFTSEMVTLSACSSIGIFLLITVLAITSLLKVRKKNENN